ncbi:MAG: GDP-L-fucose synthase, partial [Nevskiales bacterium]
SVVGYRGRIVQDPAQPDGAPRKLLDSRRLAGLGWRSRISLEQGLTETYRWYVAQHGGLRT